jgi:hypothetical protein
LRITVIRASFLTVTPTGKRERECLDQRHSGRLDFPESKPAIAGTLLDRGFIESLAVIDARANTPEEESRQGRRYRNHIKKIDLPKIPVEANGGAR